MKKTLFLLLVISTTLWSQEERSVLVNSRMYSSSNGYIISNPYNAVYDAEGWLWIIGENQLSNKYIYGEKEVIIQRFDGANFFTLKIPDIGKKKVKIGYFFKHQNKGFYLKLHYTGHRAELFYVDTKTLKITPVDTYNNLDKKFINSQTYDANNTTRLIISSKNKFYSAQLDELRLKMVDSVSYDKQIDNPYLDRIGTTKELAIVKLLFEEDGFLLNKDGKFMQKLARDDFLDTTGETFYPSNIVNCFKVNGALYYLLNQKEHLFKYENRKFVAVLGTDKNYHITSKIEIENEISKGYVTEIKGSYSTLNLVDLTNLEPKLLVAVDVKNHAITAHKQFGKDLIVLSGNELTSYTFRTSKIKTFLKNKSIRTIKQLTDFTYIVATDDQGIFTIDTKNNTEQQIRLMDNNTELSVNYSRDIFVNPNNTITIGDADYLYTLDANFKVIKEKTVKVKGTEIIRLLDTVFTANQNGTIYKHAVKGGPYVPIENTATIEVKEFATDGKTLYATTNKGIFVYRNGSFKNVTFKNEPSENLLSINYISGHGVLVSTKFGKVYTFNSTNSSLNLIYEDNLNASIVGMIADDNNNLWFNTYAGIVTFNPKTKKHIRYTTKDGIYELEGNRFSTYKDKAGNLFIGSFKGLSFFNPSTIDSQKINHQPQFTSISYFNNKSGRWEINNAPTFLNRTKEIRLPAEYRRFSVTISVLDAVNSQDLNYRYRLLDGSENTQWFMTYAGKELLYANLAAGTYTLQVEAIDVSNTTIGERISLKIIAEEVFYKKWWFLILVLTVTAGIITYLVIQYNLKKDLFAKKEIAVNELKVKNNMMLEIHHRIKNNLQIVSGLLGLQINDSHNEELNSKLQDSQNRIESIAGIHNLLYNIDSLDTIEVKDNIQRIVAYYNKLLPERVIYELDIDHSILKTDKATPFSLLLNELINNSNKHAFKYTNAPKIFIKFFKNDRLYTLEYADNGTFVTYDKEFKSMGMRIIDMMSRQLKGTYTIEDRTSFKLTLSFKDDE